MFKFQYNPAVHEGQVNRAGFTYDYVGVIVDKFENQTEGETCSGVTVELYNNEGPTFRSARLVGFGSTAWSEPRTSSTRRKPCTEGAYNENPQQRRKHNRVTL